MATTRAAVPAAGAHDFAALLADFAAPEKKIPPARDLDGLDGLADDVATLSYESALCAHALYRPPAKPLPIAPAAAARSSAPSSFDPVESELASSVQAPSVPAKSSREIFRSASVTVRLSPAENDQLRQRAAEAGLTVSAYLRSCTFEVETLRAQVKATLAELRQAQSAASGTAARKARWWLRWRLRRK